VDDSVIMHDPWWLFGNVGWPLRVLQRNKVAVTRLRLVSTRRFVITLVDHALLNNTHVDLSSPCLVKATPYTGELWTAALIGFIWQWTHQLWNKRNEETHKADGNRGGTREKLEAESRKRALYEQASQLVASNRRYCYEQ
jgi:hypothetical protein